MTKNPLQDERHTCFALAAVIYRDKYINPSRLSRSRNITDTEQAIVYIRANFTRRYSQNLI